MATNKEWELKYHSYAIADTGDYDGHYELTNGTITLITRDEIDTENPDSELEKAIYWLNEADIKWENWVEDDLRFQIHLLEEDKKKLKDIARTLYNAIVSECREDRGRQYKLTEAMKEYENAIKSMV